MTRRYQLLAAALISFFTLTLCADEGYVPVDTATIEVVSGTTLMLIAYATILILLCAYAFSLMLRHRQLATLLTKLQNFPQK